MEGIYQRVRFRKVCTGITIKTVFKAVTHSLASRVSINTSINVSSGKFVPNY